MVADLGYHFTAFRVAGRMELLGVGLMLDVYEKDIDDSTSVLKSNFLLTIPVVDIALADPKTKRDKDDCWASISFRYGYDFNRRAHVALIGFSISMF